MYKELKDGNSLERNNFYAHTKETFIPKKNFFWLIVSVCTTMPIITMT